MLGLLQGRFGAAGAGLVTSGGQEHSPEAHSVPAGQARHASGITGAKASLLTLLDKSLRTFANYNIYSKHIK